MAESRDGKAPDLPRGLIDRRGTPTAKAARLPSLRGPRDLTLGGVPKKIYAPNIPNIPARRERPKAGTSDQYDKKEGQKPLKDHSGRSRGGGGRGRGRGRGQGSLIQTPSLFELGPAVEPGYKSGSSSSDGRVSGGLSGGRSSGATSIKQENARQIGEVASHSLDHLLRDDFIADGPEDDPDMVPILLPVSSAAKDELKKEAKELSGDATPHIKKELTESDNEEAKYVPSKTPSTTSAHEQTPQQKKGNGMTVNQLLNSVAKSEKEELIFLQLPDVLPGLPKEVFQPGFSDGSIGGTNKDKKESDELEKKLGFSSLARFSEGYIGRLRVRRSGKTELVLGNVVLDVTMGTPCGFLQDVVSVRTGESDKHMTVLGHLSHRLICSPNFEYLLKS